jgi:predicted nucleotidyltransferase
VLPDSSSTLEQAIAALRTGLGENLHSCSVYGSLVRGNAVPGVSDINLLIVVKQSDPATHQAIAAALSSFGQVDPFIMSLGEMRRSINAFAAKFASIQRNYRVLYGADVLAGVKIDTDLERFLCEQNLRNLRFRLVYAFVTRRQHKSYDRFLRRSVTPLFIQMAEVLRLSGSTTVPKDFEARVPLFEKDFGADGRVLRDLLALKTNTDQWSDRDIEAWHGRVFPIIDGVISWIDSRWPARGQ